MGIGRMPRVSIRRLFNYAVYTLVSASLLMLVLHVQQPQQQQQQQQLQEPQQLYLRPLPQSMAVHQQNQQPDNLVKYYQVDELEQSVKEVENVTSAFRRQGTLPWYIEDGGYQPPSVSPQQPAVTDAWPNVNAGDRIEQQLMIGQSDDAPMKTIFLPDGTASWQVRSGRHTFLQQKCPVDRCTLTGRREDAATADAIMFKDFFAPPGHKRPPDQIWIMYMLECPLHTRYIHDKSVFNWTATYRHDSELVTPYEKWVYYDQRQRRKAVSRNFAAGKTKNVAWFVSNCGAKNNRLQYAQELNRYIDVDTYGRCGTKSCPRQSGDRCLDILAKDYKFYLAFENSNCRDYITEKFYVNGLGANVIPIVMGAPRVDYEKHAPEHSFIHVDDFDSPKELADYLHLLSQNETLYNQYFEWKETGRFINTYFFCRLCAMVHEAPKVQRRHYDDFNDWWRGGFNCIRGSWRQLARQQQLQQHQQHQLQQQQQQQRQNFKKKRKKFLAQWFASSALSNSSASWPAAG